MKNKPLYHGIIALSLFFLILFAYLFFIKNYFPSWQTRGVFGDSFGALNVIFTGLAFIATLITLITTLKQIRDDKEYTNQQLNESRSRYLSDKKDSELSINISAMQTYINTLKESEREKLGVAQLIL